MSSSTKSSSMLNYPPTNKQTIHHLPIISPYDESCLFCMSVTNQISCIIVRVPWWYWWQHWRRQRPKKNTRNWQIHIIWMKWERKFHTVTHTNMTILTAGSILTRQDHFVSQESPVWHNPNPQTDFPWPTATCPTWWNVYWFYCNDFYWI